ncbi:hypothetical protein [Marinobacter changyiensis]|uniref:hypothetical protein n=1 Tax=Marinobacter changyiensis TaxID=2604091 RepID=UPI0012653220|nr:hypothetical protein [Marinobacter changyiensis]
MTPDSKIPTEKQSQPDISLDSVDLAWTAPLIRTDGSSIALSEIQRYGIFYGLNTKDLSKVLKVDSDETFYSFKSLTRGRWHFAIVVVDTRGLKSPRSKVVSKLLN